MDTFDNGARGRAFAEGIDDNVVELDGLHGLSEAYDRLYPDVREFKIDLAGRTLMARIGLVARQAGGAVWMQYGDTLVTVSATTSSEPREGTDFLPLTVDFEERQYAVGRIPGNFFRREGRPTERAILADRLTDRSIRPLFPKGYRNEVQVIALVMAVDGDNSPDITGMIGASLALTVSDVPFGGPVGAVLIGRVEGELVVNPTASQAEFSDLHLVVAGTKDAITMVEADASEVPEDVIVDALELAHREIVRLCDWQLEIQREAGKPKREVALSEMDPALEQAVRERVTGPLRSAIENPDKQAREAAMDAVGQECLDHFTSGDGGIDPPQVKAAFKNVLRDEVRAMILERGVRPDGRTPEEVRPIHCTLGMVPRVHGSGLFTRGQTQVLTIATLGTVGDVQLLDNLTDEEFKRYMHHYNFPPFSVGETRMLRGASRRDIGHGALAERALEPVLPPEEEFPYTIRLVSEVMESNGSTSMGSVCGSTLALMDAGVPISAPVAGMAMGLVTAEDGTTKILSDIQGIEDFLGDMDFKVAGTTRGITALQMDIKMQGITREILASALEQARRGRMFILRRIIEALPEPRRELSPLAPRIVVLQIDPERIRDVIGPGGKTINRIIAETDVKIDIEDDGRVYIASSDEDAARRAIKMVQDLTRDVAVGEFYTGKVTRLMNFGAFVEILPGKEGLVHISQLAETRIGKVEDVVNVGDEVTVKVIEIDNLGRINLSRKEALREGRVPEQRPEEPIEGAAPDNANRKAPVRRRRRRR